MGYQEDNDRQNNSPRYTRKSRWVGWSPGLRVSRCSWALRASKSSQGDPPRQSGSLANVESTERWMSEKWKEEEILNFLYSWMKRRTDRKSGVPQVSVLGPIYISFKGKFCHCLPTHVFFQNCISFFLEHKRKKNLENCTGQTFPCI